MTTDIGQPGVRLEQVALPGVLVTVDGGLRRTFHRLLTSHSKRVDYRIRHGSQWVSHALGCRRPRF